MSVPDENSLTTMGEEGGMAKALVADHMLVQHLRLFQRYDEYQPEEDACSTAVTLWPRWMTPSWLTLRWAASHHRCFHPVRGPFPLPRLV